MVVEGLCDIYLPIYPPPPLAGTSPEVPPLRLLPQFFQKNGQWHLQMAIKIHRPHWRCPHFTHGIHTPTEASQDDFDPSSFNCFCDIFLAAVNDIIKGLSTSQSAATDGQWKKWDNLWRYVSLDPLHIPFGYIVPILNAFSRKYLTSYIAPRRLQVQARIVEYSVWYIVQDISSLGTKYPCLTIQGELDIWLLFQLCWYRNQ